MVGFWLRVQTQLEKCHAIDQKTAQARILEFIALSEKHNFSDAVYHRDPEEVAETIAGGFKRGGFEEPKPVGRKPARPSAGR
jgi:hypothetical protein